MARHPRHLFAEPLHYGIINYKGFFARRFERLNRLVSDLFMILSPIQVFPIHRVIERILAHRVLQTFPRK